MAEERKESKFPNKIADWRIRAELTQARLAELAGVKDQSYITKYENGIITPPISVLNRIALVFNCTIDDLINRAPPEKNPYLDQFAKLDKKMQRRVIAIATAFEGDDEQEDEKAG